MSTTSKASQRIEALLDANSFVEIGALVSARATDFNLKQNETPSDGVITGYGVIDGNLVYVYSQDASVMNGSVGEMHAKKIAKLYDLAMKTGAPVIGLIDSAGLRLQEATDALNAFGEIYMKQTLASGVIPQITAIFGTCGGGLALFPTMTDFTFMEGKSAKLFVNAPNALDGNNTSKCDSAAAKFQAEEAGIVDVVADEADVLAQIRALIGFLPANNEDFNMEDCMDDLNRVNPASAPTSITQIATQVQGYMTTLDVDCIVFKALMTVAQLSTYLGLTFDAPKMLVYTCDKSSGTVINSATLSAIDDWVYFNRYDFTNNVWTVANKYQKAHITPGGLGPIYLDRASPDGSVIIGDKNARHLELGESFYAGYNYGIPTLHAKTGDVWANDDMLLLRSRTVWIPDALRIPTQQPVNLQPGDIWVII